MEVNKYGDAIKSLKEKGENAKERASILGQGILCIAVLSVLAIIIPPLRWIISLVICLFLLLIYVQSPFPMQVVLLVVNLIVPDPLPYVDECVMALSTINKARGVYNVIRVFEWMANHKKITIAIGIGLVMVLIRL
ncbi:MAG: hypothetical protein E7198_11210 [Schwartzia succinivorans]|uniref:hypothetical protein n=1 Tax=Schwartzia succinivorans TaxID=55507 RepID=UPI0023579334|nr:hypothetical protein [Schwartzia succinivorans]MBE6098331.1 hypothetical protein [Schwartzia succinivorans]